MAELAKKKEEAAKLAEKKRLEKEQREALILREPREIFKDEAYKKFKIVSFDENGIPTHTTDGKEP